MIRLDVGVGTCIYCGDTKPPLSREHIMPRGLGGDSTPQGLNDALVLQTKSQRQFRRLSKRVANEIGDGTIACLRNVNKLSKAELKGGK